MLKNKKYLQDHFPDDTSLTQNEEHIVIVQFKIFQTANAGNDQADDIEFDGWISFNMCKMVQVIIILDEKFTNQFWLN